MKAKRLFLFVFGAVLALILVGAQGWGQGQTPKSKLRLEYLMSFHGDFVQPIDIGQTALGHRVLYAISGGTFDGPKLHGKILPARLIGF